MMLGARRGGTGSKYVTLQGGLRRAIPCLMWECARVLRGENALKQSLPANAAAPEVRARVAPNCKLGKSAKVMGPAFRMAGALLGIRRAGMGQAQQRSVRLLDQVDLDQARPGGTTSLPSQPKL